MDLGDLQVFSAVADAGGVRAAARHLNLTPAAVSRAMTRLERSVGVQLMTNTTGRASSPTSAGVALLGEARIAFAHLGRGVLMARHSARDGGVTVGLPPLPPVLELHRLLDQTDRALEATDIVLQRISWRDCFAGASLAVGNLDTVVSLIPGPTAGLREIPIVPLDRVAVLPKTHRLSGQRVIKAADLDGDRAVVGTTLSTSAARLWGLDPQSNGKPRRYWRRANSVSGMLTAIAEGRGFATMPALTPLMWLRSDLSWPALDAEPAWLGFTCGPHTPDFVLESLLKLAAHVGC
ncbi:LysR family transcriptional regulator [Mycobacterium sp. 050134]|uniref:LysR family transcriptional regulator n=1 Tax=Mycobacterium sp. 050134 TaxID=3096111 RepID=UPI003FA5C60B